MGLKLDKEGKLPWFKLNPFFYPNFLILKQHTIEHA